MHARGVESCQSPPESGFLPGVAVDVSHLKETLLALCVSSGLLCNFVAIYFTFVQFILQLKLCLYPIVHLLLEESLKSSLSRQ